MKSLLFVALVASTLALSFAGLNCDCTCSDGTRFTVYNAVDANSCYSKTNVCRYGSRIVSNVCSYSNPAPAPATVYYPSQPTKTVYLPQPSQPTQTVYYPYPQPTRAFYPPMEDDAVVADDLIN